ncbi:hypothetical protein L228DRAFT_247938 [Xylona heveae TC161]|uniref:Uncharacterized protein n=1 Tax=Xylona heveae (strain CBS 132557 / TC161) TaxID=1328760 RepID=A0A165GJX4_XYLHT|nr:hypothetical protein L228DRAFT_247938 [Xylona heveae TC161]KZF22283.1 hypothetical protein L228DRAFT_247938 [Xylona heveae TC161]
MPIRNPFRKATSSDSVSDQQAGADSEFKQADVSGARPLNIKGEPNEFKLSVVNDSGVYLPPSPPEKKGFWHRSNGSSGTTNHRTLLNENEPFSISRESFDSYRRSFDISARSPVIQPEGYAPRQSLDSRTSRLPRSAVNGKHFDPPKVTDEEPFEDIGLNDDTKPKKKGIFSRFGDSSDSPSDNSNANSSHRTFHFSGRKRGQSGQGAELGNMDRSVSDQNS